MRPLVAHCELSLGQFYRRVHDDESAHAHLTRAASQLREMQMPLWLQKAQAELEALQVDA